MFQTLAIILGLATVAVFALAVAAALAQRRRRLEAEADDHSATLPSSAQAEANSIFGPLTAPLAAQFPIHKDRAPEIQQELREAGFYHRSALIEYQAIRTALTVLPLVIGGVLLLAIDRERMPPFAVGTLILAGIGASVPRFVVNLRAKRRASQIERGLPTALDLMNLSLSAGQTIFASLAGASQQVRKAYPILARELEIVREQTEIGNLQVALRHFADRSNVPDVRNLASVLMQSDRLGTDLSSSLIEFANNLRSNLRHRAEAQASRANFWMLIPTIGCLWMAAAMMLVLPIYHDFVEKRIQTRENLTSGQERLKSFRSKSPAKADAE